MIVWCQYFWLPKICCTTVEPSYEDWRDYHNLFAIPRLRHTVEPRYNEPLYDEVLGITNDLLYPSNSNIYENQPRYNETSLSVAGQDLQIRGARPSRPWDKGGWRSQKKKHFSAFRASVWSNNKGGGGGRAGAGPPGPFLGSTTDYSEQILPVPWPFVTI